ncbi:hypothetical protein [Novibacillus thermophilus]|nr:hypothetical protein [Novibacillus thermophilus]
MGAGTPNRNASGYQRRQARGQTSAKQGGRETALTVVDRMPTFTA